MPALALKREASADPADLDERVRQLVADPLLRVIEQLDFFGTGTRYALDARHHVRRSRRREKKARAPLVLKEQLALLLRDAPKHPTRVWEGRWKDNERPEWTRGEMASMPAWFLLQNVRKLTTLAVTSEERIDIWAWIDERNPPKVKRFAANGRVEWVPYPFAFENACAISRVDPDSLRERLEPYRHQSFPVKQDREGGSADEWRGWVDDLAYLNK